jgi:SAM-dependent methyltransferase
MMQRLEHQRRHRRARLWSGDFLGTDRMHGDVRDATASLQGWVLDFGCGNRPYQHLLPAAVHYVGYDVDARGSRPDVVGTAEKVPFRDGTFDAILSTQVLEHVAEPAAMLSEIARVLRPGGRLILSAPQYWRLHEEPHDYFRFTRHGLEHLVRRAGLEVESIKPQGGVWRLVGQAMNNAVFNRFGANLVTHLAFTITNVCFLTMDKVWPDVGDTLNYLVEARRPGAS